MIGLIQRCLEASVKVDGRRIAEIQNGLLIFLGISVDDKEKEAVWLAKKTADLRVFADDAGKMNRSLIDSGGEALVISQFTLLAECSMGNRPSYTKAARPEHAIPLYELFVKELQRHLQKPVATGIFGADMKVALLNDGPVTIWLESKK